MTTEKHIPLHILRKITNGFSVDSRIGMGRYGEVYKGVYNGKEVAVKLLHVDTVQGIDDQQYINEVGNLLRVKHQNIVQLLGYCNETTSEYVEQNSEKVFGKRTYKILCSEYLQGGSLDKHLTEKSFAPNWSTCYTIIKGICEGLDFLHRCEPPIFHLDLKPANILLDSFMVPKVADLGLSRAINRSHTHVTQQISGTQAYMPPEFIEGGKISSKNDVFSLGVVMIEIMTGALGYSSHIEMDEVVQFKQKVYTIWKSMIEATSEYPSEKLHQVQMCIDTAMSCVEPDRNNRPTVEDVLDILNKTETHIPKRQLADVLPYSTIDPNNRKTDSVEMMIAELDYLTNKHQHVNFMPKDSFNLNMQQVYDIRETTSSYMEEPIIGRSEEKQKILSILSRSITKDMNILPINDIGGIVKTTSEKMLQMDRQAISARTHLERMLFDESMEPTAIPLSLIQDITNGFSDDRIIGSGGFAVVYKGILGNGLVAVKKLIGIINEEKYCKEVHSLTKANHKNIVRFLGYCSDTQGKMVGYNGQHVMGDVQQKLLCFEYVPKGSLEKEITDASRGLEWRRRYQIINGICDGLYYLHQERIVHLDLKPANILLDDNMVPKITDFGTSRCFDEMQSWATTSNQIGTLAYMAPERVSGRHMTFKSDIYSLGIMIKEILTGKTGYDDIENVVEMWRNRLEKSQESQGDTQLIQVRVCTEIVIECAAFNPAERPDIQHITGRLGATRSAEESATKTQASSAEESATLETTNSLDTASRSMIDNKGKEPMIIEGTIDLANMKDSSDNLAASSINGTVIDDEMIPDLYSVVMDVPGFTEEALLVALSHLTDNSAQGSAYMGMSEEDRVSWLMYFLKKHYY